MLWKWRLRRSASAPLRSWSSVDRLHGVANVNARLMALSPWPSRRLKNSERRHLCPATPPGSRDRQCGASKARALTCGWRIVISPIIHWNFPSC